MRINLTLHHRPHQVLPINYQYLISSWIYRTLGNADAAFATQLHEQGYDFRGRKYKMFTFGPLVPKWYDIDKKNRTITLATSPTMLELSFHVEDAVQHFVSGLFKDQHFSLGSGRYRADFEVQSVEVFPKPIIDETMQFRLLTPLCISRDVPGEKYGKYLLPIAEDYVGMLFRNLLRKQQALAGTAPESGELSLAFPHHFKLLSGWKEKLYTIKGIDVKGCLFDFELRGRKDLLELGWAAGFGESNSSLGMGMVKEI